MEGFPLQAANNYLAGAWRRKPCFSFAHTDMLGAESPAHNSWGD